MDYSYSLPPPARSRRSNAPDSAPKASIYSVRCRLPRPPPSLAVRSHRTAAAADRRRHVPLMDFLGSDFFVRDSRYHYSSMSLTLSPSSVFIPSIIIESCFPIHLTYLPAFCSASQVFIGSKSPTNNLHSRVRPQRHRSHHPSSHQLSSRMIDSRFSSPTCTISRFLVDDNLLHY